MIHFIYMLFILIFWINASRSARPGEFVAGTFVITQDSLDEAPYRYSGILRKALDKVESKDPPAKYDEKHCSVRYRILPSGQRSRLRIQKGTLSFTLKENNTVVIGAKIDTKVGARTWIWKGINLGFTCLKMLSCAGQVVTYSSLIDLEVSFQVLWDANLKKLSINMKPVRSILNNVDVSGCKPPWYLWWFKNYQKLLNDGVKTAIQEYAMNYEKMMEVPAEFSPIKGSLIQYSITDLKWSPYAVSLKANATFSAEVGGKNVTYIPEYYVSEDSIPVLNWMNISKDSKLLQGVRLSTEFINCIMWYAYISNVTNYETSTSILDATIDGRISFEPPLIKVKENGLFSLTINKGILSASCRPYEKKHISKENGSILFKAQFSNLLGFGGVRLYSAKGKSGFSVKLDEMDLRRLKSKPFEPKLPLPEAFESELMRSALSKLRPVINKYLENRPVVLPPSLSPLAASPLLNLLSTGSGTGYAQILSYCSCSDAKNFAKCDLRSKICLGKSLEISTSSKTSPPSIKNGFKNIIETVQKTIFIKDDLKKRNPYILRVYRSNEYCFLSSTASVYRIYDVPTCSPLYFSGEKSFLFYKYSKNVLRFGCYDKDCRSCAFKSKVDDFSESCVSTEDDYSFQIDKDDGSLSPNISWYSSEGNDIYSSVFFNRDGCHYLNSDENLAEILSDHANLGKSGCVDYGYGSTFVRRRGNRFYAKWDCSPEKCQECSYSLKNVSINHCLGDILGVRVFLNRTMKGKSSSVVQVITTPIKGLSTNSTIAISVGSLASIFLVLSLILCIFYRLDKKTLLTNAQTWIVNKMNSTFGFRLILSEENSVLEVIFENFLLVLNGALALMFALSWENNPLYLVQDKFSAPNSSLNFLFDTEKMSEFTEKLNDWVFSVNILNSILSWGICLLWLVTKKGDSLLWTKIRLSSSVLSLIGLFFALAAVIFTSYLDDLVHLSKDKDIFILSNETANHYAAMIVKLCLKGLSLTVISFTIVFLFHGVGGGLFIGTLLFRLTHFAKNEESLSTLLVILTILQPFICIHPVIIFSQDSKHNYTFLILVIVVWFLPIGLHVLTKTLVQKCKKFIDGDRLSIILDYSVMVTQMTVFILSFSSITYAIVYTEFESRRGRLEGFVLPAVISVFFWMMSSAYYLLLIALKESEGKTAPLLFKDRNLDSARNILTLPLETRLSLRRRRVLVRPTEPPPPPPSRVKDLIGEFELKPLNNVGMKPKQLKESSKNEKISVNLVIRMTYEFFMESSEYKDPETHGWRIKFRRIFLFFGVILFTYQLVETSISVQNYSSKKEIQKILDFANMNLTWPDSGSALDDVFSLYNDIEKSKSYIQIVSGILFWSSLAFDTASYFSRSGLERKTFLFSASRQTAVLGSAAVFTSVIIVGFPEYLKASNLDSIFPVCGIELNLRIRQATEFTIGLFFACLFTFQLIPILLTIAPALVRASVLILIHPSLQVRASNRISQMRMTVLQQVIKFSSTLSFPITFISMTLLQQNQKDPWVTLLIILFWILPPSILFLGLYLAKKFKRYAILLCVYYIYNWAYISLLIGLTMKSLTLDKFFGYLEKLIQKPTFWTSSLAQVFLCNVVISDMLYMTVF